MHIDSSRYGWRWLIVVAILIVYAQTMGHDYNLDDELLSAVHITQEGWLRYVAFFTAPYFDSLTGHSYGYRPVVLLSYSIEQSLFGTNPSVSHGINLLLYVCTGLLLYFLLKKLCGRRGEVAGIATLLFVLHPLHTEVVSSIKNRDELLAFLLFICSFIAYLRYAKQGGWSWALGLTAAVLALLSKKSALVPLLLMPVGVLMVYAQSKQPMSFHRIGLIVGTLLALLLFFSPIDMKRTLLAAILCTGGWIMLYFIWHKATTHHKYRPKELILLGWVLGWSIGVVGYMPLLALTAVGIRLCQLKRSLSSAWAEVIFIGVVITAAYGYMEPLLIWLSSAYLLLSVIQYYDKPSLELRAMGIGLLVALLLLLHCSDYSPVAWFQLSLLLSIGVGLRLPRAKRWMILWLIALPLMGYLYNGSFEAAWALPGALYLMSSLKARRIALQLLGWGLCAYLCLVSWEDLRKAVPWGTEQASVARLSSSKADRWLVQREGRDLHPTEHPLSSSNRAQDRLRAAVYTYGRYLSLHLFPHPLRVYYGYGVWSGGSTSNPWFWMGAATHLALLFAAFWFLRRLRPLSFALIFYLVALFPFSNAWVWVAGGMAERLAFAASLGYVWALAYGIGALRGAIRVAVLIAIAGTYGVMSYQRASLWRDKETLYLHDLAYTPSAKLHQLIGELYRSRAEELSPPLQQKATPTPSQYLTPTQRSSIHYLKKAEQYLRSSFRIHEGTGDHWFDLGMVEQLQYDIPSAILAYERALELLPDHKKARFNLASCYDAVGNHQKAEQHYTSYIDQSPEDEAAYANLAFLYFRRGNYVDALKVAQVASRRFPEQPNVWLNLARIYLAQEDTTWAIEHLSRAYALHPERSTEALLIHLYRKQKASSIAP